MRSTQAFDLDAFLSTVQRSRKWVDPFSDQAGSISDLQVMLANACVDVHCVPHMHCQHTNNIGGRVFEQDN